MQQLGKLIQNTVKRGLPVLKDGVKISPKIKFSLKDPYILDAIPDNINLKSLEIFENKKLNTVCRVLDDVDSDKIIARYKSFCKKYSTKIEDSLEIASSRTKNLNIYNSAKKDLYYYNFTNDGKIILGQRKHGSKDLEFLSHIKNGEYTPPMLKPNGSYPCTRTSAEQSNKLAKEIINENEHLFDGFRYSGSHAVFNDLGRNIANNTNGAEVVILDRTLDDTLKKTVDTFKNRIKNRNLSEQEKMNELMNFVDEVFSVNKSRIVTDELTAILKTNSPIPNEVLMGELLNSGAGVCRHRSLLTKFLADEIGLQSKIIHGYYRQGGHAWNEIITKDGTYLFDVMQGKIINVSSSGRNLVPQAFDYRITDPKDINKLVSRYFDKKSTVGVIYEGIKAKAPIRTNEAVLTPMDSGYIIEPLSENVMINGKRILEKTKLSVGDFVNLKDVGFQIL